MSIDSVHPLYSEFLLDWELISDCYHGERRVKEQDVKYLPATPGQIVDGMTDKQTGRKNYNAYKARAKFPDFVSQAVEGLIGIMHHKDATIELPPQLEPMREKATIKGESLRMLLRRINEAQLVTGRLGLLADVPNNAVVGTLPYIALYRAIDVINWDDGARDELVLRNLNLVVLNESAFERGSEFEWEMKKKYRVLLLGDLEKNEGEDKGVYYMGVYTQEGGFEFSADKMIQPSVAGRSITKIPFVFVNSKDIVPDPDDPPLLGLANLAMTVYRGDADYRHTLFMQGQDTLVTIGMGDEEVRAGAGARINVPQGGDAKYIGVSSNGLPEMRQALDNDKKEAGEIGGRLLDTTRGDAESGDALRIRVSARTASLNQIAMAGAEGLQAILRIMAEWVGADPMKVVVTPNLDFADDTLDGQTLVNFMTAKTLGLPLSKMSIHKKLQEKDLTDMDYEEEMAQIEKEGDAEGEDGTGVDDTGEEEDQRVEDKEPTRSAKDQE